MEDRSFEALAESSEQLFNGTIEDKPGSSLEPLYTGAIIDAMHGVQIVKKVSATMGSHLEEELSDYASADKVVSRFMKNQFPWDGEIDVEERVQFDYHNPKSTDISTVGTKTQGVFAPTHIFRLPTSSGKCACICFHPITGSLATAACASGRLWCVDLAALRCTQLITKKRELSLPSSCQTPTSIKWHSNLGIIAVGDSGGQLEFVDPRASGIVGSINAHSGPVQHLEFLSTCCKPHVK